MVFSSQLNAKSAKYLAEILPKLKSLESIDLEGNPIEAKGALYLLGDSKKLKRWGFRLVQYLLAILIFFMCVQQLLSRPFNRRLQ